MNDCFPSHNLGYHFHAVFISVIDPPAVIDPLQPAHVIEGSAVNMQCVVEGLQLKTRWYIREEDVTDDPRYKVGMECL